jgi:hypothetical protein
MYSSFGPASFKRRPKKCPFKERITTVRYNFRSVLGGLAMGVALAAPGLVGPAQAQEKRPNIVMLMTDDTGWNDFGAYSGGGAGLGHPTPNIDRIAKEAPSSPTGTARRAARPAAPRL